MRTFNEYILERAILQLEQHVPGIPMDVPRHQVLPTVEELAQDAFPQAEVEMTTGEVTVKLANRVINMTLEAPMELEPHDDNWTPGDDPDEPTELPALRVGFNWIEKPQAADRSDKEDEESPHAVGRTPQPGSLDMVKQLYKFFKRLSLYNIGVVFTAASSGGEGINLDKMSLQYARSQMTRRASWYDGMLRRAGYEATSKSSEGTVYLPAPPTRKAV